MATIMSSGSSPATSPPAVVLSPSPLANPNHPSLPPLLTSPPSRRSAIPRPMSHVSKNRLSQYSAGSIPSRSRPTSHLFPIFHSSLSYTIVRDFAYPAVNPMHYGPPPEPSRPPSGMITPASESRRLSDPPVSWDSKTSWEWMADGGYGKSGELAPIHFGDGPPWSEDEDLHSPVVSSRHRKHKSTSATMGHGKPRTSREGDGPSIMGGNHFNTETRYYVGTSGDGSERYYVSQGGEANGPGGEFVTYPPDQARHSTAAYRPIDQQPQHYAENNPTYHSESDASSVASSPGFNVYDESRYSRDYQFTITSPDEEMHGKAVALFDFERENENELPLVEGQIILVSYRHGQGWLVAMDPKTQESGLVPEEYVRLLRDIEGGMTSLVEVATTDGSGTPNEAGTPTQAEHSGQILPPPQPGHTPSSSTSNGYHQPIVSTFSTSSKDLDPYPQHLLGQHGQAPQVVHYHGQRGGSQANTPTVQNTFDTALGRRGSSDVRRNDSISAKIQPLETLPDARLASPAADPTLAQEKEKEQPPR
ncbi:hypothetical protein E0Z10_g3519 [Xylaria hypoxylon]|uniref:SH3 domain-containing protein n=1 Tax=Xylaria hypoxylon TaxID=37992 RepID=A0A4Z0Z170_9PEZI|nr:hypothetical protein E0Z10_g3519 [Xylaria hypoxylon]